MLDGIRAIILCAGKGERLRRVVNSLPKPMIKIAGKPILEHNILWVRNYGIRDIYLNLHHLSHVIRDYFEDGKRWEVRITYSMEPELLGTAGAVRRIADTCWGLTNAGHPRVNKGEIESFLVIYGDNLFDYNLNEIVEFHKEKRALGTIVLYERDDVAQSGIALRDTHDRVVKFIEKPRREEVISRLVNAGIYVLEPEVLDYIPMNRFSDFGRDIFPNLIRQGKGLYGTVVDGSLIPVDTPDMLRKALGQQH